MKPDFTMGVDLGGTSVRIGLLDSALNLVDSRSMPTDVEAGPQACVSQIAEACSVLLAAHSIHMEEIVGIGIGSPGPIDLRRGVLGHLPNLPGWSDFPLRHALESSTGLRTSLESDANAAALAEWRLGSGRLTGLDTMAMLTLGTGVGSGLIIRGRVWDGVLGMGGELGHSTINPDGPLCGCGSRGCLEMYASANGLLRIAREEALSNATPAFRATVIGSNRFTPQSIAMLAELQRDAAAIRTFERFGTYLGLGVANLLNLLDPPLVVIGGGVAAAWRFFAPSMFHSIENYSVVYRLMKPSQTERMEPERTFICPAVLGASAGLLGAGMLPRLTVSGS